MGAYCKVRCLYREELVLPLSNGQHCVAKIGNKSTQSTVVNTYTVVNEGNIFALVRFT